MTDAILDITDGTTRISLINPSSGFHLVSWIPAITDYKGGGVFQNPPLADWQQLRLANWATAEENFGLHVNGANQNGVALMLQQIRQLLEKANQYWTTDWQNDPVWLEARASCETNTRYCLIAKGRLGNDQNYYQQPFTGRKSTMRDLPLIIERRAWLDNIPGVGNATPISNLQTFNGITFGTVDDTGARIPVTGLNELFLSNRRVNQNFTHIFNFDASGASFSANLLDTIPMTFFPASPATGDIIYFGIDTSITDAGPIYAPIIFDLSVAMVGISIVWERWNGSSWASITANGTQEFFGLVGIGSVTFSAVTQEETTVNGITAYWIRVRVTSVGTATRPVQQNRNPYIANWPYFEVQSSAILGDISALVRSIFLTGDTLALPTDIFIGLRSVSRGENFTAYLNASDENNPSGIDANLTVGSFEVEGRSPSGKIYEYTPGGTGSDVNLFYYTFDTAIIPEFYGVYRMFIRSGQQNGLSGDIQLRATISLNLAGNIIFTTDYQSLILPSLPAWGVLDMGQINIPSVGGVKSSESINDFRINIEANILATGGTIQVTDIILIPTDECAVAASGTNFTPTNDRYIEIDSINYPKHHIRANIKDESDDSIIQTWQTKSNGQLIAQANERQRYWVTFITSGETTAADNASVQMQDVQRYLSLRGEQ